MWCAPGCAVALVGVTKPRGRAPVVRLAFVRNERTQRHSESTAARRARLRDTPHEAVTAPDGFPLDGKGGAREPPGLPFHGLVSRDDCVEACRRVCEARASSTLLPAKICWCVTVWKTPRGFGKRKRQHVLGDFTAHARSSRTVLGATKDPKVWQRKLRANPLTSVSDESRVGGKRYPRSGSLGSLKESQNQRASGSCVSACQADRTQV